MISLNHVGQLRGRATRRPWAWLLLAGLLIAAGAPAGAFDSPLACAAQPTASMNVPRQSAVAVTLDNGTVLVVGGRSVPGHANNEATSEVFDPATGSWRVVGGLAEGRFYHTLTKLSDGRVLAAGGNPSFCSTSSAAVYDPGTELWTSTPPMNLPRAEHAAVRLRDGRVMLIGGQTCSGVPSWTATTDIYDPVANQWSAGPSMTSPRNEINEVVLLGDGRVVVAGGYNDSASMSGVEILDPDTNSWSASPALTAARHASQFTPVGANLFLLNGGYTASASGSAVFDAGTGTWAISGGLHVARNQHATLSVPGIGALAVGGWGVNGLPVTAVEGYDARTGTWAVIGSLLAERARPAVALLGQGRVLVAGGTDGSANHPPTASAEIVSCAGSNAYLSIESTGVVEGNSGQSSATFTVSLSSPRSVAVTVDFETSDLSATAGSDYVATTGTLTFAPGTTTQTVEVLVNGDLEVEAGESFRVALSNPVNAVLADQDSTSMRWTQLSLEGPQPSARQSATSAYDRKSDRLIVFGGYSGGHGGTRALTDVWVLSGAATGLPSWRQLMPQGSGPAGEDGRGVYRVASSRFITFGTMFPDLGVIEQPFALTTADGAGNAPEWIALPHLGRANATAALDEASNRLIVFGGFEFDGAAAVYSNEVWVLDNADATGGTPSWTRLSPVGVAPAPRSGAQGAYDPHSNRLIVYGGGGPAGGPGGKFLDLWVLTHANGLGGTPEWTQLLTTSPLGPRYGEKSAYDPQSKRLIYHAGLSGIDSAGYSDTWVLVNADGTTGTPQWLEAQPGGSPLVGRAQYEIGYSATTDSVIVTQGQWGATHNFLNDLWVLDNATGPSIGGPEGVGTILNDDVVPPLEVPGAPASVMATAGNGSATVMFTAPVHDGGSPITGYTATCGSLSNDGLDSPITVTGLANGVPVTCVVVATNAVGDSLPSAASNTVSPYAPSLSIDSISVSEGDSGTTIGVFAVSLSAATDLPVTVDYATGDGTANAESDYVAVSGTLTFAPGTTTQLVEVLVKGDTQVEADETFQVTLSNPMNATIANGVPPAAAWTQISPSGPAPAARRSFASAYDSQTDTLMLYGGWGMGNTNLGDVWVLTAAGGDGAQAAWRQLFPEPGGPGPGGKGTAYFNPASNRLIVVGVEASGSLPGTDNWVLTNANGSGGVPQWIALPSRNLGISPAISYDPISNRLIVFGGYNVQTSTYSKEVWVLTNADGLGGPAEWIRLMPTGAEIARIDARSAYDPASNRLIVQGGFEGGVYQGLWVLTHANGLGGTPEWIQLSEDSPISARYAMGPLTYDAATKSAMVFGGFSALDSTPLSDTWVIANADGTTGVPQFTQVASAPAPLGRSDNGTAYAPGSDRMLMVMGHLGGFTTAGDVWVLNNAAGKSLADGEGSGAILNDDVPDSTPPMITAVATSEPNAAGWYNGDVIVRFTCTDGESGVAPGGCPADQVLSTEGASVSSTPETVIDAAGNVSAPSNVVTVNIDKTAPSISAAATTPPNAAGWYNGDVTIQFTCTDAGSGIPLGACPADQTLNSEGAAVASTSQTVVDVAGNVSALSNVVVVGIDKTLPVLVLPADISAIGTSSAGAAVTYTVSATDDAGPATVLCIPASGSLFAPGTTHVTCTATDNAGNSATGGFRVFVDLVLTATHDAFIRSGHEDTNEGANPRLRIQNSGNNRALVRFDLGGLAAVPLASATLTLNIAENSDNWGPNGRFVDAHRLVADWAEGNGWNVEGSVRGTGLGVTWQCASDTDIHNQKPDCVTRWNGGSFTSATAAGVNHVNEVLGAVSWNVTADVQAGADYGWIIKKREEGQNGQVRYHSRESASEPSALPSLVLTFVRLP